MQKVRWWASRRFPRLHFPSFPPPAPLNREPLTDYVAYDETQQPASEVNAEIVFVGYGVEAPEYKWDDYKGARRQGESPADVFGQ